jgi:hypothetical protein
MCNDRQTKAQWTSGNGPGVKSASNLRPLPSVSGEYSTSSMARKWPGYMKEVYRLL